MAKNSIREIVVYSSQLNSITPKKQFTKSIILIKFLNYRNAISKKFEKQIGRLAKPDI